MVAEGILSEGETDGIVIFDGLLHIALQIFIMYSAIVLVFVVFL